jgi:hypothetical protein
MSDKFEPIKNTYIVGNPIKSEEMFFGREDDFQKIHDWITYDGPHVILLIGGRRSGKTSILWQILGGRLKEVGEAVLCDFHGIVPRVKKDEDFPYEIGRAILENPLFKQFEKDFNREDNTSYTVRFQELRKNCLKVIHPRKLIILCDEFESLEELFKSSVLSGGALLWVKELLNQPVYFVMTGSHEFEDQTVRAVFDVVAQKKPIHELSEKDALALIKKPIEKLLTYREKVPELIYRLSGGHPFYTQYICHTLINHVNAELKRNYVVAEDLDEVIDFIVRNPTGHVQETWRRLSNQKYAPQYARHTLAALANSIQKPDEYVSTADILSTIRERRFYVEEKALYETLAWFIRNTRLLERQSENYRFRSDLIRYWVAYEFQTGEDIGVVVENVEDVSVVESVQKSGDEEEAYAETLKSFLKDNLTVKERIELDSFLTRMGIAHKQANIIEEQIRKELNLKPINWVQEYKDSCYALLNQSPSKGELDALHKTYVASRISKSQAKEVSNYVGLKGSRAKGLYLWGGIAGIILVIAVLVVFFSSSSKPEKVSPGISDGSGTDKMSSKPEKVSPGISDGSGSDASGSDSYVEPQPDEPAVGDTTVGATDVSGYDTVVEPPPNKLPVANDDTVETEQDTLISISETDLLSNDTDDDGDHLVIEAVNNAEHGKLNFNQGNIEFTPASGFTGDARFEYTVSDGKESVRAMVTVVVKASKPNSFINKVVTIRFTNGDIFKGVASLKDDFYFLQIDDPTAIVDIKPGKFTLKDGTVLKGKFEMNAKGKYLIKVNVAEVEEVEGL